MRGLLTMDHHGSGFASSPWAAAVLGHHAMASGAEHPGFAAAAAAHAHSTAAAHHHSHHHHHHHGMPMDLHVPQGLQGFPYYRYRDDALCWSDRKPIDDMANHTSVNARMLDISAKCCISRSLSGRHSSFPWSSQSASKSSWANVKTFQADTKYLRNLKSQWEQVQLGRNIWPLQRTYLSF